MTRIDVLPDDVLLDIFDFYINWYSSYGTRRRSEAWRSLVHVCRRWRTIVFGSPRRLNLQLHCAPDTPAKDTLDIWPALPLIVRGHMGLIRDTDNIISLLRQSNRVCQVCLVCLACWQVEEVFALMQVPFPELTKIWLSSHDEMLPVIPDSFLGGSAPRLQYFELDGIPFPGMPKLLLSATHLVYLRLSGIPLSGYISPELMVALLSVLSSLSTLYLQFQSPQSHPDWELRNLPPPKRSILPALEEFRFRGVTEYLDELVTRIDTPQLDYMHIAFFNQIDFDYPRLAQFIDRTPTLGARDKARVQFGAGNTSVRVSGTLEIVISWEVPDRQVSPIVQVCNSSLPPLSMVEDLWIERLYGDQTFQIDAVENTQWLQLLLQFTAVENLHLSKELAPSIAAALKELVGGGITEVLPNLQNIFVVWPRHKLSEPFRENIGQFVAARKLSDHPITVSVRDEDAGLEST